MRPSRPLRLSATTLAVVIVAVAAWWAFRTPIPSEPEGRAWLTTFMDRLTSPQTLGAKGPAALALFPGLGPWSQQACITSWSHTDKSAPIVTYQRLELGLWKDEACDQAQFGMLSTTFRQSEGVNPGAVVDHFTETFGPPDIHRDAALDGDITYTWQIRDGIFATLQEPVGPGRSHDFSLLFVRSYGSPTAIPTTAEAEQWMDRTVDLFTGPALLAAHGPDAARLLDADMQPRDVNDDGCQTMYMSNLLTKRPIGSDEQLNLSHRDGQPCQDAPVIFVTVNIWHHDPITPAALLTRITARLGDPTISRSFERQSVTYTWPRTLNAKLELTEYVAPPVNQWIDLRFLASHD